MTTSATVQMVPPIAEQTANGSIAVIVPFPFRNDSTVFLVQPNRLRYCSFYTGLEENEHGPKIITE